MQKFTHTDASLLALLAVLSCVISCSDSGAAALWLDALDAASTSDTGGADVAASDAAEQDAAAPDAAEPDGADSDAEGSDTASSPVSPGCGAAPLHAAGGVNVRLDAGEAGGGERGFHLRLPEAYDPRTPHRLIVAYPGTNWVGEQMVDYLGLVGDGVPAMGDEIFVYPDPLWRDFEGWGTLGGWLLGPYAAPANGDEDLAFTSAILDYMAENYCVDPARVFATGHSWGGDMAMVVACFLGDRFRAAVPVAANRPYWFERDGGWADCVGETAMWHMFGEGDTHFTDQAFAGEFGDACRDFWLQEHRCLGSSDYTDLNLGGPFECVEFEGCAVSTRYCLYAAEWGHQIPGAYYASETMRYFRSFE